MPNKTRMRIRPRAGIWRALQGFYCLLSLTPQSPLPSLPSRGHLQFKGEKAGTYDGAAEGHRRLYVFPAPQGPLSGVTLDGYPGTLAPPQRLGASWVPHCCWALVPSGREGQALVLGPLFTVWVQLLWDLQSFGCGKGVLLLPLSYLGRMMVGKSPTQSGG